MVGEALVVPAREGGIHGRGRLPLPAVAEDLLEDRDVQVVEVVVGVADLFDEGELLRAQQLGEAAGDLDVELAHLQERRLQSLGDGPLREAHAGELCDVLCDVAHPLERRRHPQRADHDAQVARDRLLAGEDLDGHLVEGEGLLVDDRVGVDDLFGQGDVARAEGAGGFVDGDGDELGDLDEAVLHVLEGLVEDFAHPWDLSGFRAGVRLAALAIITGEG